jgi:hypothetical protein
LSVRHEVVTFYLFTGVIMKSSALLATLLAALFLTACSEKAADATDAAAGAATEAVDAAAGAATEAAGDAAATVDAAAAPAAEAPAAEAATGGGYEPTAEERVPGETRAVDAAPVAPAAPEAAPAEAAPAN